ncbi:hypothetical protein BDV33DRAFT_210909 [Aspergillus novoparasiticus]|uniref:Uncharacterized protein n=1 Tax=Aspergillus novoparasiticus TaxID=986946 RepID=A0A5N6E5B9_9EURO|nr:hypothetical protein BDV33DRAFT_210909 [Aspergillus novoparasiticus]
MIYEKAIKQEGQYWKAVTGKKPAFTEAVVEKDVSNDDSEQLETESKSSEEEYSSQSEAQSEESDEEPLESVSSEEDQLLTPPNPQFLQLQGTIDQRKEGVSTRSQDVVHGNTENMIIDSQRGGPSIERESIKIIKAETEDDE